MLPASIKSPINEPHISLVYATLTLSKWRKDLLVIIVTPKAVVSSSSMLHCLSKKHTLFSAHHRAGRTNILNPPTFRPFLGVCVSLMRD